MEIQCIYGRDGMTSDGLNHGWWAKKVSMDNTDCSVISQSQSDKKAQWELEPETEEMTPIELGGSSQSGRYIKHLVWSSAMVAIVAVMGCFICLWETKMRSTKTPTLQSEADPLIS